MKSKFSTIEDCIHVYAQFSQDQGESGNVFFYGNTLYSYGHHFPLAHKTQNDKGQTAVLLNGRTYSNSTTRHQHITSAATSHYNQIVSFGMNQDTKYGTSVSTEEHQRNETHYILEFRGIAEKLAVSRKPAIYIEQARSLNDQAFEYFNFFGLTPSEEYQKAYTEATEASEELKAKVKAQQAEILAQKKARAIDEAKAYEVKIQEWIAGERQSLYPRPKIDLLRIVGESGWEMVETSQGVKMHIYEAKAIYLQLLRHELKAGDQVLDRYTVSKVNGTVKIGCHTFDTEYLLNFGKSL